MVLLQINEPGMTPAPHQRRLSAGIDLGTTHSLVATIRNGQVEVLADEQGHKLLPSVVSYRHSNEAQPTIIVGEQARHEAAKYPHDTINSAKRMIGRSQQEIEQSYAKLPYQFSQSENNLPLIQTVSGEVNAVQVSAEILKVLSERAKKALQGELDGVVITVPAYFDDAQRQATKDAAKLAGLYVLRLLNEPTAAAIAYGLDSGQEGVIAIYDLGGGTFDLSILRLTRGVFEVLATGGDSSLGGDDFDQLLANWIAQQAGIEYSNDPYLRRQLLDCAIECKHQLSQQQACSIKFSGWQGEISRSTFNELITPLVKRTITASRRCLKDAEVTVDEIVQVVMVGGSTRVPLVQQMVQDFFKREPLTTIDPDQVVAMGAAIQADILVGNKPDSEMLLLDVISLSLGIETMGGLVEKIIPRNTVIPVTRAQDFTTFKDGQTAMRIHVVQGERELVQDCRSLAHFTLYDIPPMTAGAAHIRVTFQVDADGLLSVTAMEKTTQHQASIQVKPSYGLSETDIANMLTASLKNAQADLDARMLVEQKVEAARVLESVQQALQQDKSLLTEAEYQQITEVVAKLTQLMTGQDTEAIRKAIVAVDKATQEFAARRMNNSIRQALAGHSVDEV